ncbi:MAG: GNAT family N-acetyltransferase [Bacilli bacterium]|nr:GNAT family N-acetyltransferase [Bacilli bacterium]
MNNIKIVDSLSAEDLYSLRESLGWKLLSIKQLERALKNTMCMVSIIKDDKCIACGRVVGDYSTKGVLSDILVRPDYQKNGYGKLVVTHLLKRIENVLSPGEQFQLEATPTHGNREFYVKCGMKYKPENQDGVYVWIKK